MICAVPFIRPRDVIKSKIGQSASDKSKSLQQAIVDHYQTLFEQAKLLVEAAGGDLPIIATGHLTALGVTSSDSVRDIYIGTLEALPSNVFPAADYIALGHIHRAQKVGKTEHIRYCGSPIALSFDEAKQNKRVLMVDFKQSKLARVTDLIVPCFQALAMVKTSLENLTADIKQVVTHFASKKLASKKLASKKLASKKLTSKKLANDDNTKVWLDIELSNSGLLSNLQPQIMAIIADFPVEVLLVRREKQVRKHLLAQSQQDQSTLNELSLEEVFSSRLNQEAWLQEGDDESVTNEQAVARKNKLQTLFKQTVEQVLTQELMPELIPEESATQVSDQ